MPANMMSAPVGSSFAVAGSSSATVSAGPTPGSTPTAVPSVHPTSAHSRFCGVSATAKPCASSVRVSMRLAARHPAAPRQLQRQAARENEKHDHADRKADNEIAQHVTAAEAPRGADEQQRGSE